MLYGMQGVPKSKWSQGQRRSNSRRLTMNGFGLIHDLADIEVKTRRHLMEALHNIDCAKNFATDFNVLDREKIDHLEKMLAKAIDEIKIVIGN